MYSPKELEGEVDHSFFDSDCEEHGKEDRGDSTAVSGGNSEGHEQMEPAVSGEGNSPLPKEDKGNGSVDENRSRPSSASSLLSFEEKSEADGELDKNPSTHFQITAKIPTGLSAEENGKHNHEDDDEDGYKRSEEDTEEESDQKPTKSKAATHCLSKKSSGKFRSGKHSPVSSSKSDSSYSSTEDSSASEASPQRIPACSPPYRAKLGALARREKLRLPPEESEDTVTDVTPLSTPDISPVQSFELALRKDGERERVIVRQQNVLGGLAADDVGSISEAFMKVNKRLESELVIESSGRRPRKNYSFSNDDVVRIDRENQRLLRELTRRSPRPKSGATKKPGSPPVRPCHSALNRQREQQRIERENMAFLKRLETAKATPGMKRSEQLSDYQRQARYLGAASPSKSERSPSSRSSAGKSSRLSSASSVHRARPASSVSTAVSKTSRTAWP
ncbi:cilia- and flagella-associated protein 97 [Anguilla rostrata]|uniref:cilia- and flagella-associated protein 97 n=1 Tax=Anguilla rostrata TaxID=7938 RepID=UPI0030CC8EB2